MKKEELIEKIKEKKWIVLIVAVVVLILLLLLLLHSCGGNTNSEQPAGPSEVSGEITYDEELVSTWYLVDVAMVLNENGNGSIYYGDSDGGEIQWHTVGNYLTLATEEKTTVATYVINGDELTLTHTDGKVETWNR